MQLVRTPAEARVFFAEQHAGQVDKIGRDYYLSHLEPIAAALAYLGPEAEIAGLGHDWIEDVLDGDIDKGIAELRRRQCPERSIRAIVSVTRIPGESYNDLIDRSCADELGVEIKLVDNRQNLISNPDLAVVNLKQAKSMINGRYLPARDRLLEARVLHALGLYPQPSDPSGMLNRGPREPLPAAIAALNNVRHNLDDRHRKQ